MKQNQKPVRPGRVQRQTNLINAKQAPAGQGLSESQQLQRRLGNEAIGNLVGGQPDSSQVIANNSLQAIVNRPIVQAKLQVNQPNDPFEQEADEMSGRVANQQGQAPAGTPPTIQRAVPESRYETGNDKQPTEDGKATEEYANKLDDEVQKASAAIQNGPLLGSEWNIDGHTQLWIDKMTSFAQTNRDPGGLHTSFGYVVESLVSGPLKPAAPAGYQVITQGARGGTRPDFILRKGAKDIGWLDLTASKSKGHIFDKAGGWEQVPSIAEITYPSIEQAELQLMKGKISYNQDSQKYESPKLSFAGLDPTEIKKRIAEAKAALEIKKAGWKVSFQNWLKTVQKPKGDWPNKDELMRARTTSVLSKLLKLSEHSDLASDVMDEPVMASMLQALTLNPKTYGFLNPISVSTGLSYLQELDPEVNSSPPEAPRTKSAKELREEKEKRRRADYKPGIDPKKFKETRFDKVIKQGKERREKQLNAKRPGLNDIGNAETQPMDTQSSVEGSTTDNNTNADNVTPMDTQSSVEDTTAANNTNADNVTPMDDTVIQSKLEVNQPNDPFEQEADQMARQVSRPEGGVRPGTIQAKSVISTGFKGNQASETVQRDIEGQRGRGQTLNNKVRQPMEQAFGNSFAGVNVHTDAKADNLNRELGARAFTTGRDIFFRQGEYQPEAPAGKELLAHELTHVVQQGGATHTVQRSVGFEFEDSSWRAWKYDPQPDGTVLRPARRKEVLHHGNHFTLEGDDTPGPQASNLEFVTEPFDTTPAGIGQLNITMTEIKDIVGRIGGFSGRQGNLQNTNPDQFVLGHEHQLQQPNTRLSAGQPHARFKMQATQGISAEDLPTIMKYLGTNVAGENAAETQERTPARQAMYGGNPPINITNLIGNTPGLALQAVNNLIPQLPLDVQGFFHNNDALVGFISAAIMYIKLLAVQTGNVLKYNIPLLARNNFVALYQSVPFVQRHALRAGANANLFFQALLNAANQQAFIPRLPAAGGGFWDENRQLNDPLVNLRIKRTPDGPAWDRMRVMDSLTVQNWLQGIVVNGVDHMQPHTMMAWLTAHEPLLNVEQRQRSANMLESFASLGGNKDEPEQAGKSRLNIFENRGIAGNDLNEDTVHHKALNYLDFFVNLRQNGGQPGQFPDNPVP